MTAVNSDVTNSTSQKVFIDHYSDILCVWAYASQIRIDELQASFAGNLKVTFHFFSVFGDVPGKMEKSWAHRGGVAAYGAHVQSVAEKFEHININADCWVRNAPSSSLPAHLFLKAAQFGVESGAIAAGDFSPFMQAIRHAFFVDNHDISQRKILCDIAENSGLPVQLLCELVDKGIAHSGICADAARATEQNINSSPTLMFNEGRQKLAGNVGYRIIEANVRELLENPPGQLSWC
ncbi:DsbA family oxidoreductase [Teredinibacter waterburyi]|uniref:DsbA family oxidoreductase n=1 Tax=Teredinibacter waterburyi TaxID=1500538 RepID=UPI00165FB3FC|nr:DsbA family protein [Teredinibacter waterburyi]